MNKTFFLVHVSKERFTMREGEGRGGGGSGWEEVDEQVTPTAIELSFESMSVLYYVDSNFH